MRTNQQFSNAFDQLEVNFPSYKNTMLSIGEERKYYKMAAFIREYVSSLATKWNTSSNSLRLLIDVWKKGAFVAMAIYL